MNRGTAALMPKLMHEIELYLEFMEEARTEDPLERIWREYQARKSLPEKRQSLRERLEPYSMR